jgi:DNA-binding NtrC family response regulator
MMEKSQTLMIAEPSFGLANLLGDSLAEKGYTVKSVGSIKDALITLQAEKINVLVIDACLALDMDCESISIIKGVQKNLPIIVATDVNNPEQESSIRQRGIFYYHVKSFGVDELMLAITNAMTRSH